MTENERSAGYYAVIPADVRYDDRLPSNAKLLYGEISALTSREGYCFASNQYFADLYKLTTKTISGLISKLEACGYILTAVQKNPQNGQILGRCIYLSVSTVDGHPVEENFHTPGKYFLGGMEKNFQYNIKDINIYNQDAKGKGAESTVGEQFGSWLKDAILSTDEERQNIQQAFEAFLEARQKKGKPLKSKRALTMLCNRLASYSGGNPAAMEEMLAEAALHSWESVYPPKNRRGIQTPQKKEVDFECL